MPRSVAGLSPHVDQRLAAWDQIQSRLAHAEDVKVRPTITLSRAFGCEGFPLAERLAGMMEASSGERWTIYDKQLLDKVAQDEGLPRNLLENLGRASRALEAFGLYGATHGIEDKTFEKVARCLVQIARVGNAVIVGRGGAILCSTMRNCFHFRIEASLEWRVQAMMRRLEMSQKDARYLVETSSRQRDRFVSYVLGANVADHKYYDAIFNNERHSVAEMAAAIVGYVRAAWPDATYFADAARAVMAH